jgi:dTDP-4-amino-4,6-dideoxygalactose transaminase
MEALLEQSSSQLATGLPILPLHRPTVYGPEMRYVSEAIRFRHLAGDGPFTRLCENLFEEAFACPRTLLTTSCTHAMEIGGLIFGLQAGDEVILPTFTFVSTANAFALRDARPIFCDIRADTLNLDERLLPHLLTSRTKGIVVVHYGGIACEMDPIMEFASQVAFGYSKIMLTELSVNTEGDGLVRSATSGLSVSMKRRISSAARVAPS